MSGGMSDELPPLPPLSGDAHKGDAGRVVLIGGSLGMAGSIALSGRAALRSGSGLVTIAVPHAVQTTVAGFCPAVMTTGWDPETVTADDWLMVADGADAVAIGPGLGRDDRVQAAVREFVTRASQPVVVDADALFALRSADGALASAPRVLTPHAGEFARLHGVPIDEVASHRVELAEAAAAALAAVVVLKGPGSVVTDGGRTAINRTGNAGLATGGSGDVLTGIIAALLGQQVPAWDAARLAGHVHGLAGDIGAARLGQRSLTAVDLPDLLAEAWQQLEASRHARSE